MKTKVLTTLLALGLAVSSQATVVVLNATAGGGGAEDSSGTKYNDGQATFMVGYFTTDGNAGSALLNNAQIQAFGADPAALDTAFVELGASTSFNAGGIGLFGDSFNIADLPADATPGLPLSAANYNTQFGNNVTMYAYIKSATEVGVWDSGVNLKDPGTVTAFDFSFTPNFNGNNVTTLIGGTGTGVFFGGSLRTTRIIPEPATASLFALALGAVFMRRRRRA